MNSTAVRLVELLKEKKLKITCAESCTGGLLMGEITAVAGSSAVFDGGLCSYSNDVKHKLLGVSRQTLDTDGAVSAATAVQMAEGVMALFASDLALSITGIAGPGGGTDEKPVGTVFICGTHINGAKVVKRCRFTGDRAAVRQKSVETALKTAISLIEAQ